MIYEEDLTPQQNEFIDSLIGELDGIHAFGVSEPEECDYEEFDSALKRIAEQERIKETD